MEEKIDHFVQLRQVEEKLRSVQRGLRSLNHLKPSDYPGFFTIKDFLIMLDGIYEDSFFLRNPEKGLY